MAKARPEEQKAIRMGVSELKAKLLGVIDEMAARGGRIVITKHGREVAELRTLAVPRRRSSFGCMRGQIKTKGDIVNFDTSHLWDALK